jgi:uncharacterized protein YutD
MKVLINEIEYEIIEDNKGFDKETVTDYLTDYFYPYDYILGDWSYGKLRLKGFYDSKSKGVNKYNDYRNKDNYLKEDCAYGAAYFIMKKIK